MTARNLASEVKNHLEMVKKTCQALKSLNSNVRDRTYLEITMLGQDEHETDTKNQTSTNSTSELTNPLQMVKNQFMLLNLSILMFELGIRPKLPFCAQMSSKQTQKIGLQRI